MKTNLGFNLFLALLLSSLPNLINAQVFASNYDCQGIEIEDCFRAHINMADVVFEGTVINGQKFKDEHGNWKIKNTYAIERSFKGNFSVDTITLTFDVSKITEKIKETYEKAGKENSNIGIRTSEAGTTGVILGVYPEGKEYIEPLMVSYSLTYNTNDNKNIISEYSDKLVYAKNKENQVLSFETADDLYDFILEQENTSLQNISGQEFFAKKKINASTSRNTPNNFSSNVAPVINNFTPRVPAGVEQTIEINGSGFGNSPGRITFDGTNYVGIVMFGATEVRLDNYDLSTSGGLLSWSDDKIVIKVPSISYSFIGNQFGLDIYDDLPLMSSRFKIGRLDVNGNLDEESSWTSDDLDISFSAQQTLVIDEPQDIVTNKLKFKIATNEDDIFYFYVTPAFYGDCEKMAALNTALKVGCSECKEKPLHKIK